MVVVPAAAEERSEAMPVVEETLAVVLEEMGMWAGGMVVAEEGREHQLGDLVVGSAVGGEAGATAKEGALVGGYAVARVELPEATAAPEVMAAAPRSS